MEVVTQDGLRRIGVLRLDGQLTPARGPTFASTVPTLGGQDLARLAVVATRRDIGQ